MIIRILLVAALLGLAACNGTGAGGPDSTPSHAGGVGGGGGGGGGGY